MNINEIRQFNRDLTIYLGVYDRNLFNLHYPMLALRIIMEIDHKPGINAYQLVKEFKIDKGYLSRIINNLVKDKLLKRVQDKNDRRIWNLTVTKKGHELAVIINQQSDQRVEKIIANIPDKDKEQVFQSIQILQRALDKINQAEK